MTRESTHHSERSQDGVANGKRGRPQIDPAEETTDRHFSGGHSVGETPVPIPNTEVKPHSADGTALATEWESRSLPENS